MTKSADYPAVLAAIRTGIDVRRSCKKPGETQDETDELLAWCVLQELRRAGWSVVPAERDDQISN